MFDWQHAMFGQPVSTAPAASRRRATSSGCASSAISEPGFPTGTGFGPPIPPHDDRTRPNRARTIGLVHRIATGRRTRRPIAVRNVAISGRARCPRRPDRTRRGAVNHEDRCFMPKDSVHPARDRPVGIPGGDRRVRPGHARPGAVRSARLPRARRPPAPPSPPRPVSRGRASRAGDRGDGFASSEVDGRPGSRPKRPARRPEGSNRSPRPVRVGARPPRIRDRPRAPPPPRRAGRRRARAVAAAEPAPVEAVQLAGDPREQARPTSSSARASRSGRTTTSSSSSSTT